MRYSVCDIDRLRMYDRSDITWRIFYNVCEIAKSKKSQYENYLHSWLKGYKNVCDIDTCKSVLVNISNKKRKKSLYTSGYQFSKNILLRVDIVVIDIADESSKEATSQEIHTLIDDIVDSNKDIDEIQAEKPLNKYFWFIYTSHVPNSMKKFLSGVLDSYFSQTNSSSDCYKIMDSVFDAKLELCVPLKNEIDGVLHSLLVELIFNMESKLSVLESLSLTEIGSLNIPKVYLTNYPISLISKNKKRLSTAYYLKMVGDLCLMFGHYIDGVHFYNSALKYFKNDDDIIAVGATYEAIYIALYNHTCNQVELNPNYRSLLESEETILVRFSKMNRSHEQLCVTTKNQGYDVIKLLTKFNVESALIGSIYSYLDFACECYISNRSHSDVLLLDLLLKYLSLTYKHNMKDKFLFVCNKIDSLYLTNYNEDNKKDQIKISLIVCSYNISMGMYRKTFFYFNRLFAIFYATKEIHKTNVTEKIANIFDRLLPLYHIFIKYDSNHIIQSIDVIYRYKPVQMKWLFMYSAFFLLKKDMINYLQTTIVLMKFFGNNLLTTISSHIKTNFWDCCVQCCFQIHAFHLFNLIDYHFNKEYVITNSLVHISKFNSSYDSIFITSSIKDKQKLSTESLIEIVCEIGSNIPLEIVIENSYCEMPLLIKDIKLVIDYSSTEAEAKDIFLTTITDITIEIGYSDILNFTVTPNKACDITIIGIQYMVYGISFQLDFPENKRMLITAIDLLPKMNIIPTVKVMNLALETNKITVKIKNTTNEPITHLYYNEINDPYQLVVTHFAKRSLCTLVIPNDTYTFDVQIQLKNKYIINKSQFPLNCLINIGFVVFFNNRSYGYHLNVQLDVSFYLTLLMDKFLVKKPITEKNMCECTIGIRNFSNSCIFKVCSMEYGVDKVENIFEILPGSYLEINTILIPQLKHQDYINIINGNYVKLLELIDSLFLNKIMLLRDSKDSFNELTDVKICYHPSFSRDDYIPQKDTDSQMANASIQWLINSDIDFDISNLCLPLTLHYEILIGNHAGINNCSENVSLTIPFQQLTPFFVKVHNMLDIGLKDLNISIMLNGSKISFLWVGSCFRNYDNLLPNEKLDFFTTIFPIEQGHHTIAFSVLTAVNPLIDWLNNLSPNSNSNFQINFINNSRLLKDMQKYVIVNRNIYVEVV